MTLIVIIGLSVLNLAQAATLLWQAAHIRQLEAEIEAALYERHTSLHEF